VFGHALFGWDAFAQDWKQPQGAVTAVVAIPGGHRRKDQRWRKEDEQKVKTRDLTVEEREALDQGFRENHPQPVPVIPDAVPVYVAPPIGAGIVRKTEPPKVSTPSVSGAVFDATASQGQRERAFTFFDRLETKLDQAARRATAEAHRVHAQAIQYARALAVQQRLDQEAEQARLAREEEDDMLSLLMIIDEMDL
jgi:hypothetical protein